MWKALFIVKKSNHLVNARFDFSVLEVRLFTLMVSQITNEDKDFKIYKIPVKDFVRTFNIKNKNIYKELEKTTDSLIKKIIKIPIEESGQQKLFKTSLVNSFKYNIDGSGIIEATFHPDLKPYLLQLKNRFLMYDMKHVLNISSSNSIRMYELLKAFEGIGKRTFEVEELKEILGVAEKYHGRYYNFKKRIILQAQKDLKKYTDISFTFRESKTPWTKKVEKITFFISPNGKPSEMEWPGDSATLQPLQIATNHKLPTALKGLKKYKFSSETIGESIIWKYDISFIKETLKHCEQYFKQAQVPNKEGFILKALEKGYYQDEIDKAVQKKQGKTQKETVEQSNNELEKVFQRYLDKQVEESLQGLSSDKAEELKKAFLSKADNNSFFKKALDVYGFEHHIIQGQRKIFLRDELLSKEQRSREVFQRKEAEKGLDN